MWVAIRQAKCIFLPFFVAAFVCAHFVAIRQMIGLFNGNTNLFPNKQEKFNQIMDINTTFLYFTWFQFVSYFLGIFFFCWSVFDEWLKCFQHVLKWLPHGIPESSKPSGTTHEHNQANSSQQNVNSTQARGLGLCGVGRWVVSLQYVKSQWIMPIAVATNAQ